VAPEDVLAIITRDVPEASGEFLVRSDGKIDFPLVGEVAVGGLTLEEIRVRLTDLLKKELRNPQLTVNVKSTSARRIYVLGAVTRPAVYDYKDGWRITELVAAAGGLNVPPERVRALVFRSGNPTRVIPLKDIFVEAKDDANVPVLPGDVVNFQTDVTMRVTVVGEVARPGTVPIFVGQGIAEALAAAGGASSSANLSKARLTRGGQEVPINLYEATVLSRVDRNTTVQEGDTLFVPRLVERISVVGMVARPGSLLVPDGRVYTLSQAVSEAGGMIRTAKSDSVNVARLGPDGKVITEFHNLREIMRGNPKHPDPRLKEGDIVFVPQSGRASLSDIGSAVSILFFGSRIIP
jgi:polysaccharide export outer membrane protein